jgi:hypothetical protein
MGNQFKARSTLKQEYAKAVEQTQVKFARTEKRRVLFVGPSGKGTILPFQTDIS